jgi:hypothetical protein
LLAAQAVPVKGDLAALGLEVTNCADKTKTFYKRIVPIQVAVRYTEKSIDAVKFRGSWIAP